MMSQCHHIDIKADTVKELRAIRTHILHETRNLRAPEAIRSWFYRTPRMPVSTPGVSPVASTTAGTTIDELVQTYGPQPGDAAISGSEVRMVWETLGATAPRQGIALTLTRSIVGATARLH
jgi:hypothetical protein